MKTITSFFLLFVLSFPGWADSNPTVTNATITPSPIQGSNPYVTFSFDVFNTGSQDISHLDIDGNPDPIVLIISFSNGSYDNTHYSSPTDAVGGSGKDFFSWTYNSTTATYTGTQIAPLPSEGGGTITMAYKATTATPQSNPNNGFNVNLTSNGNAPNGPGTNDTNDDNTSSRTYVDGPMPVTLIQFNATKEGRASSLTWATSEETNADFFEVERSTDAKGWQKIGVVNATGESKVTVNYSFTDSAPISGTNYYRLKMIDNDATFSFSKIENVGFEQVNLVIYPNPTADVMFLKGVDASKVSSISIHNSNGRTVYASSQISPAGIDVSRLSVGIYLVNTSTVDGVVQTQKVLIAR
ncbi:T9SS type A sorting domain-containing protein [Dyadobacter aurulentus]|uniref:T9SS type A sorting domain-containing protein n=1 Tax=Dyadobacter sp. UC 10 TaxID=2605428 RepID=UPI0011F1295C|nr:T9SS type A sorting domain-containing protein [Dyadobacter sp. UC 10]KAA0992065.1 T9SS type A sorting domain-containing protein [Dyadobacter sp. UC 10]